MTAVPLPSGDNVTLKDTWGAGDPNQVGVDVDVDVTV